MPRITLLGIGGAISPYPERNSGGLIELENGNQYLVDCGQSFPQLATLPVISLPFKCYGEKIIVNPIDLKRIQGVFITHCHSDHIGGLEFLGFYSYFLLKRKMKIFTSIQIKEDLQNIIFNSMRFINNEVLENPKDTFDFYFEFESLPLISNGFKEINKDFESSIFDTRHCIGMPSVGFSFAFPGTWIMWSGDSNEPIYTEEDIENNSEKKLVKELIFQDCSMKRNSNVHVGFDELPNPRKSHANLKVVLMHYGNGNIEEMEQFQSIAIENGFVPGKPFQVWEI